MVFCHMQPLGGIFEDTAIPTHALLVFMKPVKGMNSFGEVTISFVSHVAVHGDLQPLAGKFPRYTHGDTEETRAVFIVIGNPDVRQGMRTLISGAYMEIMDVDRYGTAQADINLKWIGRP